MAKTMIIKKGEAFLSLDNSWKCIYINDWASHLLNKKREVFLGSNYFKVIPETLNYSSIDQLNEAKENQSSLMFDVFFKDGKKWLQLTFVPHFNGADVFFKDITERKLKDSQKELKEKRFAKAFESSPIALLIIDYFTERIVDVNQSFLTLFEFNRQEVIGNFFHSLQIIDYHYEHEVNSFCELLKNESIYKYDVPARTKKNNGQLNIILSSETIKVNGDKQMLLTFIDLTEKIKFQKLLLESEEWFRGIADKSPILIWGTDEKMNCNYVNQTWKEFTGFNQTAFAWKDFVHEQDLNDFLSIFDLSYKQRKSFKREFRLKNKYGNYRWMYEFANPIFLPDGSFKGFIGSCSDIDDKKNESFNLEKLVEERTLELTQSLEKEKLLNDAKTRFVSLASHEFRTPLSSILSSVYLIEKYSEIIDENLSEDLSAIDPKLISQRKKHLERIKNSIHHLTSTLNDFLSIDQLEQGKFSIKYELFDLNLFTKEFIDEVKGILKKGQVIHYSFSGDVIMFQDKRVLKNIFMNLISNAIKYSKENQSIFLTIEMSIRNVFIEVKDEGIGIPYCDQPNLFQKFYRAENVSNIEGTGLGLNIVKKYAELVNGKINFQSCPDKGSSFIITLPRNLKTKN